MSKTQGEIFGIALLFVVIIIGFLVYARFQALNPNGVSSITKAKYEILSQSTLNTLIKIGTGCYTQSQKDSVEALIEYSLRQSFSLGGDPLIACSNGKSPESGKYAIKILNNSLFSLFNSSNSVLGPIPFLLQIRTKDSQNIYHSINLTNFGQFGFNYKIINETNYLYYGFNRAPSGLRTIPIANSNENQNVNFILFLYFR